MKSYMKRAWNRLDMLSLIIGLLIGLVVAINVFCYLVPNGEDIIKYYRIDNYQQFKEATRN